MIRRPPARVLPPCLLLLIAACAGAAPPVSPTLAGATERSPVVLVPGMTGVMLREVETGRVAWGSGANLLGPDDGGLAIALPIDGASGEGVRHLEPFAVLEEIHLAGVIRKSVYGPVMRLLEANGYRRGDLAAPEPGDTFFPFVYDWRQDATRSARELAERLENLRRERGEERLAVNLVCQSNGSHICRWLARYGGAGLDEAEAGRAGLPTNLAIEKIILVGTANGGSLRILREMDRGRRYVPVIGRRFRPETFFTVPALYQDLPAYRSDLFLDAKGEPLDVDLYDATSWREHGWSVFGEETARRLAKNPRPEILGTPADRAAFLARMLYNARRFHDLLAADDPGYDPPEIHLIQNDAEDTPDRAVLVEESGGWRALFTGDRRLIRLAARRPLLLAKATAPGDGHASRASQLWLSREERQSLVGEPFDVDGDHFEMILKPAAMKRLLAILEGLASQQGGD